MATTFDLTNYPLDGRTRMLDDFVTARDRLDDGEMRIRVLGTSTFRTINCIFQYLSESESSAFEQYLITNKATEFDMVIDDQSPITTYRGYIWSDPRVTVSEGSLYTWAFDFRGKVV